MQEYSKLYVCVRWQSKGRKLERVRFRKMMSFTLQIL